MFDNDPEIQGFVLQLFKRLYNTFPKFRAKIEDPIIICLKNILSLFRAQADVILRKTGMTSISNLLENDVVGVKLSPDFSEAKSSYI